MEKEEKKMTEWQEGFMAGVKVTEAKNGIAIKLGESIIHTLYEVFEPKKEDYD